MSLAQAYQYYGYNPYPSVPYQYYPSQNIPSLQTYSYLYSNSSYSVSNTTLSQPSYSLSSSKSKNLNTLFVKNLPFEMSSEEVKKMFEKYGEVAFIKSQIHKQGMAFITFYDMRSAEKAYEKLHGTDFSGRHLVVDFSFKKNNPNNSNVSLFIIIEIIDYSQAMLLNLDILRKYMASYGEIYNAFALSPYKYVIQFYDYRCSQNAARLGNNFSINGARCNIYIPEEDPVPPVGASLPEKSAITSSVNSTISNPLAAYNTAYNSYSTYSQQPQQLQSAYQSYAQSAPQISSQISQPQQQLVQAQQPVTHPQQQVPQPQQQMQQISQQISQAQQMVQVQPQHQVPQVHSSVQSNALVVNQDVKSNSSTSGHPNDQMKESLKKLNLMLSQKSAF